MRPLEQGRTQRVGWLTRCVLAALLVLVGLRVPAQAEDSAVEYKIKAGFLLNFAKFTSWPTIEGAGAAQFTLCVVGVDPFGSALAGVSEKQVDGKNIRLLRASAASEELSQCRLLFVSRSEQHNLEELLRSVARKPILTVSDLAGFAEAGGTIELKNREGRLSFIVNNSKARESGLRLSASLLNLALEVR